MKNIQLFIICALASMPPWGIILRPFGLSIQLAGLFIQLLGLTIMIVNRKSIF